MTVTVTTWLPLDDAHAEDTTTMLGAMMRSGAALGAMPVTFAGRRYLAILGRRERDPGTVPVHAAMAAAA
jgi:hypothetical protein